MSNRQYLLPRSVDLPSQGDFLYQPLVKLFENNDILVLENDINTWLTTVNLAAIDTFFVIEDVKYQITTTRDSLVDPVVLYSALVWYHEIQVN